MDDVSKSNIPDEIGALALGTRLRKLGSVLQHAVHSHCIAAGVSMPPAQMPVLAIVADHDGITVGALADQLGLTQPGVSRMVDSLIADGYLEVLPSPTDKRLKTLKLTVQAQFLVQQLRLSLWPQVAQAVESLSAGLEGDFLTQLNAFEHRLTSGQFASLLSEEPQAQP